MLSVFPIPAFTDNYIWVFTEGGLAFVVDPGESAPVMRYLRDNQLTLGGILVTHHHADHIGGIDDLLASYKVPVYGPHSPLIPQISHPLSDGEPLTIGSLLFKVMEVPGHTLDHIAYFYDAADPLVFCGDTLFAGGCGRIFEGTPEQMHASLTALAELPSDTRICCTHEYTLSNLKFAHAVEPNNAALAVRISHDTSLRNANQPTLPSTLQLELATNPFLRASEISVQKAAAIQRGSPCENPTEVFAAIRGWKDHF